MISIWAHETTETSYWVFLDVECQRKALVVSPEAQQQCTGNAMTSLCFSRQENYFDAARADWVIFLPTNIYNHQPSDQFQDRYAFHS